VPAVYQRRYFVTWDFSPGFGGIQPSLPGLARFFNLPSTGVLGYFQPSAFGGLEIPPLSSSLSWISVGADGSANLMRAFLKESCTGGRQ
jgi:hypothetical protein